MKLVSDAETHEVVTAMPVGSWPREMEFYPEQDLLFVACQEDLSVPGTSKGVVYVIDTRTYEVIKTIDTGYQPQSLALDRKRGFLYASNRNIDPVGGDAPHHSTGCEGNNGYLTRIDLKTLEWAPNYRVELSVDPYATVIR